MRSEIEVRSPEGVCVSLHLGLADSSVRNHNRIRYLTREVSVTRTRSLKSHRLSGTVSIRSTSISVRTIPVRTIIVRRAVARRSGWSRIYEENGSGGQYYQHDGDDNNSNV